MTGILTPSFYVYYSKQLNQLPRSIKIDTWRRLTSRKHSLLIEQASSIHPEVEDLLNKAVGNYIKQKERQKMKPITSDCETSLRQENEELCISKQVLEKKIEELLDLQEQYKSREVVMTILAAHIDGNGRIPIPIGVKSHPIPIPSHPICFNPIP